MLLLAAEECKITKVSKIENCNHDTSLFCFFPASSRVLLRNSIRYLCKTGSRSYTMQSDWHVWDSYGQSDVLRASVATQVWRRSPGPDGLQFSQQRQRCASRTDRMQLQSEPESRNHAACVLQPRRRVCKLGTRPDLCADERRVCRCGNVRLSKPTATSIVSITSISTFSSIADVTDTANGRVGASRFGDRQDCNRDFGPSSRMLLHNPLLSFCNAKKGRERKRSGVCDVVAAAAALAES